MSNNVTEKKWWQSAVVYQIYQKSFQDWRFGYNSPMIWWLSELWLSERHIAELTEVNVFSSYINGSLFFYMLVLY